MAATASRISTASRTAPSSVESLIMRKTSTEKLMPLSVEYNLTEHCNLSCYACDHASPLMPEKFASVAEFSRDFDALGRVLHSQQLQILGGEPLLHPQILEFLAEARRIAIADAIVLITNGVLLHEAPDELWGLIDQLWIAVYPGVKIKLNEEERARICKEHDILLNTREVQSFRKALINNRIDDPELVKFIFHECKMAGEYSCHTVHDGRFYKCSVAPFIAPRLALRGIDFDNRNIDGISLHNNPKLFEDLDRCLNGPTPLAACSYCLGTSAPWVAHHQLNRQGRAQWLKEDNRVEIESVRAQLMDATTRRAMVRAGSEAYLAPPSPLETQIKNNTEYNQAWEELALIYFSRYDLQKAFPLNSPASSAQLLEWAGATVPAIDPASAQLKAFQPTYKSMLELLTPKGCQAPDDERTMVGQPGAP